jgi:hypothetical protein
MRQVAAVVAHAPSERNAKVPQTDRIAVDIAAAHLPTHACFATVKSGIMLRDRQVGADCAIAPAGTKIASATAILRIKSLIVSEPQPIG